MYIHLGEDVLIKSSTIIGIFDLEKTTISKYTKEFLGGSTKKHSVITVSYEMPKSFVVCVDKKQNTTVYISQISVSTLNKRAKEKQIRAKQRKD